MVERVSVERLNEWAKGREPYVPLDAWDWVTGAIQEIRTEYPANWDGEGAEAISQECVTQMATFLDKLKANGFPPPWTVYGLFCGGVMAEWIFDYKGEGDRDYARVSADMSVLRPGRSEVLLSEFSGEKHQSQFVVVEF